MERDKWWMSDLLWHAINGKCPYYNGPQDDNMTLPDNNTLPENNTLPDNTTVSSIGGGGVF